MIYHKKLIKISISKTNKKIKIYHMKIMIKYKFKQIKSIKYLKNNNKIIINNYIHKIII